MRLLRLAGVAVVVSCIALAYVSAAGALQPLTRARAQHSLTLYVKDYARIVSNTQRPFFPDASVTVIDKHARCGAVVRHRHRVKAVKCGWWVTFVVHPNPGSSRQAGQYRCGDPHMRVLARKGAGQPYAIKDELSCRMRPLGPPPVVGGSSPAPGGSPAPSTPPQGNLPPAPGGPPTTPPPS